MNKKICVSIPYDERELKKTLPIALSLARYVELRIDYSCSEPSNWLKKFSNRLIVTCRRKEEGGNWKGSEEERLRLVKSWVDIEPAFVDLELRTAKENLELVKKIKKSSRLIVSWHNFEETPSFKFLLSLANSSKRIGDYIKIVTKARTFEDNIKILRLYKHVRKNLIAFCMGDLGIISRVLCIKLGAPFTYASFSTPTALGQVNVKDLVKLYDLIS